MVRVNDANAPPGVLIIDFDRHRHTLREDPDVIMRQQSQARTQGNSPIHAPKRIQSQAPTFRSDAAISSS
jgi:hypothetical protein